MRRVIFVSAFLAMMGCGEVTSLPTDSGTPVGGQSGMTRDGDSDVGMTQDGAGGRPVDGAGGAAGTPASSGGGTGGAPTLCCEACGTSATAPACAACPAPPTGEGRVCGCGTTATLCCCFNPDGSPHCSGTTLPVCQ